MPTAAEYPEAVAAARKVLDDLGEAFNNRDAAAWEAGFNFPSVRLASGQMVILNRGDQTPEGFSEGALTDCDRSEFDRCDVIHAGPDKVHLNTRFTRYRKDGSVIGSFDTLHVITCEDGHWGVKFRSTYAPF